MKQSVGYGDFIEAFKRMGRESNFTRDALGALYDYLTEYEESTGEEIELDVIAICCEFAEFDTATEAAAENGWEADRDHGLENDSGEDEIEAAALAWLQDRTTVIEFDGGVVIQSF
jgi:hypothetical protein